MANAGADFATSPVHSSKKSEAATRYRLSQGRVKIANDKVKRLSFKVPIVKRVKNKVCCEEHNRRSPRAHKKLCPDVNVEAELAKLKRHALADLDEFERKGGDAYSAVDFKLREKFAKELNRLSHTKCLTADNLTSLQILRPHDGIDARDTWKDIADEACQRQIDEDHEPSKYDEHIESVLDRFEEEHLLDKPKFPMYRAALLNKRARELTSQVRGRVDEEKVKRKAEKMERKQAKILARVQTREERRERSAEAKAKRIARRTQEREERKRVSAERKAVAVRAREMKRVQRALGKVTKARHEMEDDRRRLRELRRGGSPHSLGSASSASMSPLPSPPSFPPGSDRYGRSRMMRRRIQRRRKNRR